MLDMSNVDINDLLPLTPASFHILLVLAGEPSHGYAVMQEVARMTGGSAQLGPGTLYRTIQKLLDDALIEALGSDADERRVPYKLTKRGASVARAETRRLALLVQIATQRHLLPAGASRRGAHV
jgi:DNA-binding PadR family transcriptional regulator